MDTLSRLNALLQSLRHAPAHFTITSETIFSVRLTLDPATMKLVNADPYLSARVNAALKKGAKDKNRGAAKRKAALDVVGALESLVTKNNVHAVSNESAKKKKMRTSIDQPAKTKASRKAKKEQQRSLSDDSDVTETEEEKEDGEISSDGDNSTTHRAMRRANLDAIPRHPETLAPKKRKRSMTEDVCAEERKRKDARRM